MNRLQFDYGMEKLKGVFGPQKYPLPRVDILFERFQGIDGDVFRKGIDNLIVTCKFPPMVEEFYGEFHDEIRQAKELRVKNLSQTNGCVTCKNTGRLSFKIYQDQQNYAFRCNCIIGANLFPNYPKYNPSDFKVDKKA